MAKGPVDLFLQNLSYWSYSIPLQTQWIVKIDPVGNDTQRLISNITTGTQYDKSNFQINQQLTKLLLNEKVNNDVLGLFFAQKVSLPGEGYEIRDASIVGSSGGFLEGATGGDRDQSNKKTLSIDFFETNVDFIDFVVKPWIITGSYRGLLARNPIDSIKCNIYVYQYTKTIVNPNIQTEVRPIRKIHQFFDCQPYNVDARSLEYGEESVNILNTKWIYNNYTYKINEENLTKIL